MSINLLQHILRADQTVFSINELSLLYKDDQTKLKNRLSYYTKKGYLYRIRKGLYAKNSNYNRYEVATKLMSPSYISFETVLLDAGITFQWYSRIFVASYQSRTIECDSQTYHYRELKGEILTNNQGITILPQYSIASPERAFLDIVYLHKGYWFDNFSPLNWDKVFELVSLYNNERVKKDVNRYYKAYKERL